MGALGGVGIAAAGAGAGVAALRRRRPVVHGPDPGAAAEADVLAPPPADVAPPEDPQEALDAARERLRERADALREQIERRRGGAPPPG